MSLVVLCMVLSMVVSQHTWPVGDLLMLAVVAFVPAVVVDLLVLSAPDMDKNLEKHRQTEYGHEDSDNHDCGT